MSGMFSNATSFNNDISSWDTDNAIVMSYMFDDATSFNSDISSWDTDNVNDMSYMFNEATGFSQNISGWNIQNVTDMTCMFRSTVRFNKYNIIRGWDIPDDTKTFGMFVGTSGGASNTNSRITIRNSRLP